MRICIISQCYWPDTASVAQHLEELCGELVKKNHEGVKQRQLDHKPTISARHQEYLSNEYHLLIPMTLHNSINPFPLNSFTTAGPFSSG